MADSPNVPLVVRPMREADWPAIAAIYVEGIATFDATFATEAPATWQEWSAHKLQTCRLVGTREGAVVGWAVLSPISPRYVYRGVAEVSVYVAAGARGQGVGKRLLTALVEDSEAAGIWTLQAGIFPENLASLHLHRVCGFRTIGVYTRLGLMEIGPLAGTWRDVVLLERRSDVAGI